MEASRCQTLLVCRVWGILCPNSVERLIDGSAYSIRYLGHGELQSYAVWPVDTQPAIPCGLVGTHPLWAAQHLAGLHRVSILGTHCVHCVHCLASVTMETPQRCDLINKTRSTDYCQQISVTWLCDVTRHMGVTEWYA